MNYITCPHCGETYRNITAVHVCSSGPYAVKLLSDTNSNMNERIRELMKQSGAYDYYEINEGVNGDELPMIRFAELIVEECVGVVMGGRFLHDEAPGAQFARECSAAIKRHFEK